MLPSLPGTVSVAPPEVYVGEPNTCTDRTRAERARRCRASRGAPARGHGHRGAAGRDGGDGGPGGRRHRTCTRAASPRWGSRAGGYACVLQAELAGESRTLGFAGFRGAWSRPSSSARSSRGPARGGCWCCWTRLEQRHATPSVRRARRASRRRSSFLQELLTRAGWSYTLTESAEDFDRASCAPVATARTRSSPSATSWTRTCQKRAARGRVPRRGPAGGGRPRLAPPGR